jgi:hypothetical protein
MNQPPPTIGPTGQVTPKRHGCFFYGCITSLVLLFLVIVTGYLTVRYIANKVNTLVAQYTDTQPMAMPVETMPKAEMDQLQKRFKAFQDALDARTNATPLILTGREINALLTSRPGASGIQTNFHLALESNQIKGEVSLPLDQFQMPFLNLKGRYLNGAGVFKAALTNQQLFVGIDSLEVKGQPIPEKFMSQIRGQNFAADAQKDPTNAAAISRFESIEIKDGKLIITPKQPEKQ